MGGPLKKKHIAEFLRYCNDQEEINAAASLSEEGLLVKVANKESIEVQGYDVNWGEFEDLEQFCHKNGLTYYKTHGAGMDYGEEEVHYDGATNKSSCASMIDSEAYLTHSAITNWMKTLEAAPKDLNEMTRHVNDEGGLGKYCKACMDAGTVVNPLTHIQQDLEARKVPTEVPPLTLVD